MESLHVITQGGRSGEAAWNGERFHHMDAQQLPGTSERPKHAHSLQYLYLPAPPDALPGASECSCTACTAELGRPPVPSEAPLGVPLPHIAALAPKCCPFPTLLPWPHIAALGTHTRCSLTPCICLLGAMWAPSPPPGPVQLEYLYYILHHLLYCLMHCLLHRLLHRLMYCLVPCPCLCTCRQVAGGHGWGPVRE